MKRRWVGRRRWRNSGTAMGGDDGADCAGRIVRRRQGNWQMRNLLLVGGATTPRDLDAIGRTDAPRQTTFYVGCHCRLDLVRRRWRANVCCGQLLVHDLHEAYHKFPDGLNCAVCPSQVRKVVHEQAPAEVPSLLSAMQRPYVCKYPVVDFISGRCMEAGPIFMTVDRISSTTSISAPLYSQTR